MSKNIVDVAKWINNHEEIIGNSIGTLGVTIFASFLVNVSDPRYNDWNVGWVIFLVLGTLASLFLIIISLNEQNQYKKQKKKLLDEVEKLKSLNTTLEQEKGEMSQRMYANSRKLIEQYLKKISINKLEFGKSHKASDRISLYFYYKNQENKVKLFRIGRFSFNDQHNLNGRSIYPADKGCIGVAWNSGDGWFFANDFPDSELDREGYLKIQYTYGISNEVAEKLSMKSRLYCGWRITNNSNEKMAILVIESTDPERFEEEKLKRILNEEESFFNILVNVLRPYIIDPDIAEKEGF